MTIDRYNRLKVLNEYGYDIDWSDLHTKKVAIVGLGGLGAVSSSHLARFGVSHLTLIDFDTVEEENLNRLFFNPSDIGKLKVDVTKKRLLSINSEIKIETHAVDVMGMSFEDQFAAICQEMDLLMMGVDNFPARHHINICCVDSNLPYIDAGANRNGLGGWVHPVIPRKTACYACVGTVTIGGLRKEGDPCTASLPTTMAILASIQAQEAIKYLLAVGKMIDYLFYDAMTGSFVVKESPRNNKCYVCGGNQLNIKESKEQIDNMQPLSSTKGLSNQIRFLEEEEKEKE